MFYEDVFRKLDEEAVRYVVIGGVALVLYGVIRLTADLDLFVGMGGSNLKKFLKAMKDLGYKPKMPVIPEDFANPEKRREWKQQKGMKVFSFYHPAQPMKLIDSFVIEAIHVELVEESPFSRSFVCDLTGSPRSLRNRAYDASRWVICR